MRIGLLLICVVTWSTLSGAPLRAQDRFSPIAPSEEELAGMLESEPLGETTWPNWRQRYLDWHNERTKRSRQFSDKLAEAIHRQWRDGELPAYLANDAIAWHLCARGTLDATDGPDIDLSSAEMMSRRAIELNPTFGGAHEGLAGTLIQRAMRENDRRDELLSAAELSIAKAHELDPEARVAYLNGCAVFARERFADSETLLRQAMADYPESESVAVTCAQAILRQDAHTPTWSEAIAAFQVQFPDDADLMAVHAMALARENKFSAAAEELRLARTRKPEIDRYVTPDMVTQIESMAKMMTPDYAQGLADYDAKRFTEARRRFRAALDDQPENVVFARSLGHALLAQSVSGPQVQSDREIGDLAKRFPEDGELQALAGVSLANRQRHREAVAAFDRAKRLGFDPATLIGQEDVDLIVKLGQPGFIDRALSGVAWFVGVYACLMTGMVAGGLLLSKFNREAPKVSLAVADGKVAASTSESWSARIYMLALILGLIMFYVAIPFVVVGAVGLTLALLYGVLMLPRIPIQLLVFVGLAGFAVCWGILKSVFARRSDGAFGIRKTAADLPRLHAAIHEVARTVGTNPTDEVYLAPGSEIGVHQEGRGPFGAFGVKRRVLTLGLSSLQLLTVSELKAILAHEYAHFSHSDTAHSRVIHQVTISIEDALRYMGSQLGRWNYANPFYWFFYGYYRAYNMLAAGFSRTREYLADRMAVAHYGKTAFISGLTKVATDGQLFEATAHNNIRHLLTQGKVFENVYDAFRDYRDNGLPAEERENLQRQLIEERPTQFATHPTFSQRAAAIADFPDWEPTETDSALTLVDDVEGLERAMTEYLTSYHSIIFELLASQQSPSA